MPSGIYKHYPHTEEHKKRLSDSMKGKSPWIKGKKLSIETRKKISLSHKGKKHSKEWNEKVGKANKGKIASEETRRKMSIAKTKNPTRYWLGKKRVDMMGENHFNWRGGISKNVHSIDEPQYKFWRKSVFERDNYKCKVNNQDCCSYVEAHHILPWRDYPELRYNINNGITLCRAHHPRKRAEEKRLAPIFQELVSVSN
jgi:hypothetical protein